MPKQSYLFDAYPEIARQLHPTKNSGLDLKNLTAGSNRKVWWKCDEGPDHEWQATIHSRTKKGGGCTVCSGRKTVRSNSLGTLNPQLAAEWHPSLNGSLTPFDVPKSGGKAVWWKCPQGDDHVYKRTIDARARGMRCPICAGRMVVESNCLETTNPELAKDWHPVANGTLTPKDVTSGTHKRVWWKCDVAEDHVWQATVANRNKGDGCPMCRGLKVVTSNSLKTTHPEIAADWHPTLNGDLSPNDVVAGSNRKVWWKCSEGEDHEWQAQVNLRKRGTGCPVCEGLKVVKSNSLATTHPELATEWHPTKNGNKTPDQIIAGSNKKVWWKCDRGEDHEWRAPVVERTKNGRGCGVCAGTVVVASNCLETMCPNIASEWHQSKNGKSTARNTYFRTAKKAWWQCAVAEDHVWRTQVNLRVDGSGCPACEGLLTVPSNSLKTTHPEVSEQWHPTKNGSKTPSDFVAGSNKHAWWKCPKGEDHEWRAQINSRTGGTGCPVCQGHKTVPSTSIVTTHPEVAKMWHPTKNGELSPSAVSRHSNKKVWWKCPKGNDHEWATSVNALAGCPICSNRKVVASNNLQHKNPSLAAEWHPVKNGDLTPLDVVAGGNRKVWWKCSKGIDHEWKSTIGGRVSGDGCPFCRLTPQSRQELTISFELQLFFDDINPRGFKTKIDGVVTSIDIYIPSLNLGIEFDGSYWHKGKREFDKIKTEILLSQGFQILRIRESPLKKILPNDVISQQPFDGKTIVNDILCSIAQMYPLSDELCASIDKYRQQPELKNEGTLDRYIEMILKEKAQKKK